MVDLQTENMETATDFTSLLIKNYEYTKQNKTFHIDLSQPFIRPSLRYFYPLFIFLHACTSVIGIGGNCAIIVVVIKHRLYKNPTFFFIGNLALSDTIKAAIVAPITLANLLMQNFIFGSFMCFFLPMMHSFPMHASMLTYTMLAADRYRYIVHPMKSRVPAGLCTIAVWVISVCVVLPFAVYIKYVDLRPIGVDFGLCMVDHSRHIEEYIRAMFVIFYCLPLAVIAFLYVKVSTELKSQDSNSVALHIDETAHSVSEATYQTHITWASGEQEAKVDPDGASFSSTAPARIASDTRQESEDDYDLDMRKEKRTQKYLIAMVTLFAMCWCPMTILILATHFVYEDNENQGRFDITYLTFTFFAYMSTCVNPVLFASWRMSDRTKNRLRGYFQFSNRRSGSSQSGKMTDVNFGNPSQRAGQCNSNGNDVTRNPKSYV